MTERAGVDYSGVALCIHGLHVVHRRDRGGDGVGAAMTSGTHDSAMTAGVLEELAGFLELPCGMGRLMAAPALGLIQPGLASRVSNGLHRDVAGMTVHVQRRGAVDIALAVRANAGMTCIAFVLQTGLLHPRGMSRVHRRGEAGYSRLPRRAECIVGVASGTENGLTLFECRSM